MQHSIFLCMSWHEHCRVNPFYDCYQCQVRGLSYTDRVLHLWGLFSYLTFIIILVKICIQSKIISKYCLVIASIVGCLRSNVGMMHMWYLCGWHVLLWLVGVYLIQMLGLWLPLYWFRILVCLCCPRIIYRRICQPVFILTLLLYNLQKVYDMRHKDSL